LPNIEKQKELSSQLEALSAETQRLAALYEQKIATLASWSCDFFACKERKIVKDCLALSNQPKS
jgi:hypothetical protein